MKINALFIENKANLGKPQFAGYTETFDDVPEMCMYALPNFFSDKAVCKMFAKKLRECFDAKGDPENFFDSIIRTNLYGWANTWKIVKNEITIYVMKQLVSLDALKPASTVRESLNKLEEQNVRDIVQDWADGHYDFYNRDEREDLLDDVINYNAEMYLDMLHDTGLRDAKREKKEAAYDILKEIVKLQANGKKTKWYEEWLKNKKPVKCPECHLDFEAIPAIEPDTYVCPSCGRAFKRNSLDESNYYETGALEFDDDGECHDKKAIAKVWHDVLKYPGKEDSFVIGDTTYLFCIVLSRSLTNHFWAVYPDCKDPKQAEKKLPEYLTRNRPEK